jgi:hypothetical protein
MPSGTGGAAVVGAAPPGLGIGALPARLPPVVPVFAAPPLPAVLPPLPLLPAAEVAVLTGGATELGPRY